MLLLSLVPGLPSNAQMQKQYKWRDIRIFIRPVYLSQVVQNFGAYCAIFLEEQKEYLFSEHRLEMTSGVIMDAKI